MLNIDECSNEFTLHWWCWHINLFWTLRCDGLYAVDKFRLKVFKSPTCLCGPGCLSFYRETLLSVWYAAQLRRLVDHYEVEKRGLAFASLKLRSRVIFCHGCVRWQAWMWNEDEYCERNMMQPKVKSQEHNAWCSDISNLGDVLAALA